MKRYGPMGEPEGSPYVNGDGESVLGSILDGRDVDQTLHELIAIIEAAGLTPDPGELDQVLQALQTIFYPRAAVDALLAGLLGGADSPIVPTGAIFHVAGTVAPVGFIKANGATLARASYADLWAFAQASGMLAVSEAGKDAALFGPGDGSTTFTVPDLRGLHLRGWDNGRGLDSGRAIGTTQQDQSNHLSNWQESGAGGGIAGEVPSDGTWSAWYGNGAGGVGSYLRMKTFGRETRVKNAALLAVIKY